MHNSEQTQERAELLSCPFCGSAAHMRTEHDPDCLAWHFICCDKCGARSRGKWNGTGNDCPQLRAEVRDEWNLRTPNKERAVTDNTKIAPATDGMFPGESVAEAAQSWAGWCEHRSMTGLSLFLRKIAVLAAAIPITSKEQEKDHG